MKSEWLAANIGREDPSEFKLLQQATKENENGTSKALKHVSDSAFNKFNESIGVTTNGQ